jgi:hypothetical protein
MEGLTMAEIIKLADVPNFESLDRIHLDKKEDVMKVVEWGFEHANILETLTTDEFPLKEAVIRYSDIAYHHFKTYETYGDNKGNLVLHSLFYYGELYLMFLTDLDKQRNMALYVREENKWGQAKLDKYMYESYIGVQALMVYMLHYREDFEYKEVRKQKSKKTKLGKKKKNTRIVKIGHYYMNVNKVTQRTTEVRTYTRQTGAWRQRGFWRTYKKSGKRVWIEPQIKGPEKSKINPTIYKI